MWNKDATGQQSGTFGNVADKDTLIVVKNEISDSLSGKLSIQTQLGDADLLVDINWTSVNVWVDTAADDPADGRAKSRSTRLPSSYNRLLFH